MVRPLRLPQPLRSTPLPLLLSLSPFLTIPPTVTSTTFSGCPRALAGHLSSLGFNILLTDADVAFRKNDLYTHLASPAFENVTLLVQQGEHPPK